MTRPRACDECGRPVLVSKHNHRTEILIGPNNEITSDRVWHTECDPFTVTVTVTVTRKQPPQGVHSRASDSGPGSHMHDHA